MIVAALQARVSSTRLPGKVLMPILDVPMLFRQVERIRRSRSLDELVIATSTDVTDDPIERGCDEYSVRCFRGSLSDVLDRVYRASAPLNPRHVVRLTGDCPLTDPAVIDRVVAFHLDGNYDYTSNVDEPTFPDGLDVEIVRFACLEEAWREARLPSQREHVTPFIREHPEHYRIGSFRNEVDLSHFRWTVDEPEDFALIETIYTSLYPENPAFSTDDILMLLASRPELTELNSRFKRNEGYLKSREADAAFRKGGDHVQ